MSKTKRPKLPKAFKRRWVAALRSGEYEQGRSFLRNANGSYCCLGVACKVAGCPDDDLMGCCDIDDAHETVPKILRSVETHDVRQTLIGMNDRKHRSFRQIAAYIERYL